jgi:large subunit ribosomal protein L32
MAAVHTSTAAMLSAFLPRFSAPAASAVTRAATFYSRQLSLPVLPSISFAIPSAIHLNLPTLLGDIWESVLRAVPKKKTSHSKKRSRFMAGKGLKDVTSLNKCSGCGHLKRAHLLCPYCVKGEWNS